MDCFICTDAVNPAKCPRWSIPVSQRWGLIDRQGRRYYIHEKTLNSLIGMRSYRQVRRILSEATQELTVLDTLPD